MIYDTCISYTHIMYCPGTQAQQEAQPWNFEAWPFYDRTNASYGRTLGYGTGKDTNLVLQTVWARCF